MTQLLNAIQYILGLGSVVMLPIVITIMGLIFGMKFGKALISGLLVGIGFTGLNLVIGLLMGTVTPAAEYYRSLGEGFTLIEIGWTAVAGATWAAPFAALAIPLGVLINYLLLRFKVVKVMNVDIWNYVVFLMPGSMAYALSGSFILGLVVTVGLSVLALFVSQWVAPYWQKYFGLEGTTCTTLVYLVFVWPVAILVNKLFDLIPGLKKVNLDMEWINAKLGFFGNPAIIGLFVGALLGVLTRQTVQGVLSMAVGVAAVLVLMPRMVSILMEGLSPIGSAIKERLQKGLGEDQELLIGMDIALALGDPITITASVICVPLVILMAFLIPGNNFFPTSMLTTIIFFAAIPAMASKGNLLRTVVATVVVQAIIMFFANLIAPEASVMLTTLGIDIPANTVTDASFGSNPFMVLIALIYRLIG